MPKLKVFCTTSGFYDQIVAAPSKAAALKAWGAKTDLFSMGAAQIVRDAPRIEKALARPGEIIRIKRASGKVSSSPKQTNSNTTRAAPKKTRRPSRAQLSAAEKKFAAVVQAQATAMDEIGGQIEALRKQERELSARHKKALKLAKSKVAKLGEEYERDLAKWEP